MSDALDVGEFLAGYLLEVEEHLSASATRLLQLDELGRAGKADPRRVRELFRSLHTVKGLSAMVGAQPIVDVSHEMESLLREADRSGGRIAKEAIDVLLEGVRAIEDRVRLLAKRKPLPAAPAALLEALVAAREGQRPRRAEAANAIALDEAVLSKLQASEREQLLEAAREGRRAVRLDFFPNPERAARGLTITSVRERLSRIGELVKVLPRSVPATAEAPGGLAFTLLLVTSAADEAIAAEAELDPSALIAIGVKQPAPEPEPVELTDALPPEPGDEELAPARASHVRVEVARLDDALEKLAALVVGRFRLERAVGAISESGSDARELRRLLQENGRQLRDLRGAIMRARMVPVAELLERVPLIVRGLSRTTGKPVRARVEAGQTELDKAVAETLFPAIVHLVRNAVDHAIEPVDERERSGKPAEGRVTVAARERADHRLELSVSDDGRGIDAAKVAARAQAPVPTSDAELLALITRPGLSTREQATETSGRGMGMDIVKKIAVDQLGGDLAVTTSPAGTTFTIRVPLSLTIVEAFSLIAGGQRFVVPVSGVDEIVEVDARAVSTVPAPRGARTRLLRRRGEALPLLSLAELLGSAGAAAGTDELRKALVVRRDAETFAFAIERMLGQQEVVVRPVDDPLVRVRGVAGATDLGDGRPTLVLDLAALCARAREHGSEVRA